MWDTYSALCGLCYLQAEIWCKLQLREAHCVTVNCLLKVKHTHTSYDAQCKENITPDNTVICDYIIQSKTKIISKVNSKSQCVHVFMLQPYAMIKKSSHLSADTWHCTWRCENIFFQKCIIKDRTERSPYSDLLVPPHFSWSSHNAYQWKAKT